MLTGDDRDVGQRLHHARDVESRRNGQHAFLGGQHRVAVEVGDHEAPAAAQHLTDVQVAVPFDDRRARERTETGEHVLDLGQARPQDRVRIGTA